MFTFQPILLSIALFRFSFRGRIRLSLKLARGPALAPQDQQKKSDLQARLDRDDLMPQSGTPPVPGWRSWGDDSHHGGTTLAPGILSPLP